MPGTTLRVLLIQQLHRRTTSAVYLIGFLAKSPLQALRNTRFTQSTGSIKQGSPLKERGSVLII